VVTVNVYVPDANAELLTVQSVPTAGLLPLPCVFSTSDAPIGMFVAHLIVVVLPVAEPLTVGLLACCKVIVATDGDTAPVHDEMKAIAVLMPGVIAAPGDPDAANVSAKVCPTPQFSVNGASSAHSFQFVPVSEVGAFPTLLAA
jgi:hypothetical protein